MKRILSIIISILCLSSVAMAEEGGYYYGFCDKDLARTYIQSLSSSKSGTYYYAYIHLSAEDATMLAGNKITHLYFSLGYCSASSVKICITEDPTKTTSLYSQNSAVTRLMWNDIELAEPYTIEAGKEVYIGYEVKGTYSFDAPVDVVKDGTYGNTEGDYLGIGTSKAKATWSHTSENGYGNLCILALVEGESLPKYNASLNKLRLSSLGNYVRTGDEFALVGTLRNNGIEPIKNIDVTYDLGTSHGSTNIVLGEPLQTDSTTTFSLPAMKMDKEGQYSVNVTVTKVNGEDDADVKDNTLTYSFWSYDNVVARNVLLEMFTSQTCQNCPDGHHAVEHGMEGRNNVILVTHHSGFAYDKYTCDEDKDYEWFFGDSPSNPAIMVDRTNINDITLNTDNYPTVYPYYNRMGDYIDYCLSVPSFMSIDLQNSYDETSRHLEVMVSSSVGNQTRALVPSKINVWLVEDSLIGAQKGTDESYTNYVHNGVMRTSLTGSWGEQYVEGEMIFIYDLPTSWNANNMRIVAFVSNYDSSNQNNCNVMNAVQCKIGVAAGIPPVQNLESTVHSSKAYNLSGQRVNQNYKGIIIKNGIKFLYNQKK